LPGDQIHPAVSLGGNGGYVVWEDNRVDGKHGPGIAAVALDSNLVPSGEAFRVNQRLPGSQGKPQVQVLGNGNTLFIWEVQSGPKPGVYARMLGADGKFSGGDVQVSQSDSRVSVRQVVNWYGCFRNVWKTRKFAFRERLIIMREQTGHASIGALADGSAVIAYQSACRTETNTFELVRQVKWRGFRSSTNDLFRPTRRYGASMQDIFFQRLDAAGKRLGPEVKVNQFSDFNQRSPAMTVLADGRFVIVWVCESPRSSNVVDNLLIDLRARIFDADGQPVTDEFAIASGEDVVPANPSVGALPNGGFTAFWSQQEAPPSRRWDVYGRVFGADGSGAESSFPVNEYTLGNQFAPRVASSGDAQLVVWTSTGQDGSREGVYGSLLTAGALSSSEFRLNTTTASRQLQPVVAADGQGNAVAVWASFVGETGVDLFGSSVVLNSGQAGGGSQ
jgi:hypothetical protein